MATATEKLTGFGKLRCPKCGEAEATIRVDLDDLLTFACTECDEEFGRDDVEEMMAAAKRWARVLAWLDTAPAAD